MHNWAKEIMECLKSEANAIGFNNMDDATLCKMEKWSKIADNIAEYDYYYNIVKAMEESEYGTDYDENGRLYYGRSRDSRGRFVSRKGYEDMMHHDDMRDMDKGRMYYTELGNNHKLRYYTDAKKTGKSESERMKSLENDAMDLKHEVDELMLEMTPNERSMFKNKVMQIVEKL